MPKFDIPETRIISQHRFKRPAIRLWLPLLMLAALALCGWVVASKVRLIEMLAMLFLVYVATSSLVSISEITVVEHGLIIQRLILPERFVPWSAIDRVLVYSHGPDDASAQLEIASIGIYEGLSLLNRLPGPAYGHGFRQTLIVTPDTLEDYDGLIEILQEHCQVFQRAA